MSIKLSVTTAAGTADITQLLPGVNWSGEYTQCARTLQFSVLSSPVDANIPTVDLPLGAGVTYEVDGAEKFNGFIFERQKLTDSDTVEVTCYDRGIYLRRNKAVYKFTDMTPEDITRRVCADFGITVGRIAATGVKITRNFIGVSLYQIIQTAYTLAADTTREAYQIRFKGAALEVLVKEVGDETVIIRGGSNMQSAAVTESVSNMINQVVIYDADETLVGTVGDSELIGLYGLMQDYLKQSEGEDASAKAQKTLRDNGVSQKITVYSLGGIECVTGNAVVVQEPYTGLFGLFWIESDTHTWKNGLYLNKLTLNFRRMMDEQEAGAIPAAQNVSSGSSVKDKYIYIYKD